MVDLVRGGRLLLETAAGKVVEAKNDDSVVVRFEEMASVPLNDHMWMHVDERLEGTCRLMQSDHAESVNNIGSDRLATIDEWVDIIAEATGKQITEEHVTNKPQGVPSPNWDNSRLREVLDWEPD